MNGMKIRKIWKRKKVDRSDYWTGVNGMQIATNPKEAQELADRNSQILEGILTEVREAEAKEDTKEDQGE